MQLYEVHGRHSKACAVHHAGNISVQRHIVELVLRRLALHRVFLRVIAHFGQRSLAKQRVIFDVDLGVQGKEFPIRGHDQRIDLHQAGIAFQVQLVNGMRDFSELRDLRSAKAHAKSQLPALKVLQPGCRMNIDADDLLRGVLGNLFNVHPARRGGDKGKSAGIAIQHQAQVDLACDL